MLIQVDLKHRAFISGIAGWPDFTTIDDRWYLSDIYSRADIFVRSDSLRRCPACQNIFLEDPRMYEDPDRCPACGAALSALSKFNKENIFND